MGGNALKQIQTRRYAKDEYEKLRDHIYEKLKEHPVFSTRKIKEIQAYADKPSFGDMDILVESDNLPDNTWDIVSSIFKPQQLVRNGSCTSFDVEELQIDMILAPNKEFDITAIYFSYNDLGNLMGRVAHNLGFKYGHQGLIYTLRDENKNKVDEIHISMDPEQIFNFLGYDFKRYSQGFKDLDDIFNFTISSPYFNKKYYRLEDRNYASRIRDKKRKTYREFLLWIEQKDNLPEYETNNPKAENLERAFLAFPEFRNKYDAANEKLKNIREMKQKFNGALVSKITGLTGDALGEWIQAFKKSKPDFNTWVLTSTPEIITQDIENIHKKDCLTIEEKEHCLYNRTKVRTVTGFDGRKLKMFMTDFKQKWPTLDAFQAWVLNVDEKILDERIKDAAENFDFNQ